ncbi:MAG: polysaccharide deacetylase family protein [Bacteroidales bacterium]|nr:polysaccharide deacetylase family protein [Bacteroidales bacterium]
MILIYTTKATKRIRYICRLIFKIMLKVDMKITTKVDDFRAYDGAKINYSGAAIDDEIFFAADELLFHAGIDNLDISFVEYAGIKTPFAVYDKNSDLPFDPFAASFYMVSRYEEYLPYMKDEHGRFSAHQSMAYQQGFLQKPVVNIWAYAIRDLIKKYHPEIEFPARQFKYIPTIDIDQAYSYKLKGFVRTMGGYLRSLSQLDFHHIAERTKVLAGLTPDPFDTYQFLLELQRRYNLKPVYFILFADYGHYNKNIHISHRKFHILIKSLADYAEVGIHPSYDTNEKPGELKAEVKRLSRVLNREITKSRQHYLRVDLPVTYRNLINLDITDDYSMGFASELGFRAGICDAFPFYDLDLDTATHLWIHPFQVMDGTLRDYMNIRAGSALSYIKPIIDEIKALDGTYISLWHNETLGNLDRWVGWHKVYEEMTKYALKKDKKTDIEQ